jgi:hypothetical protein
VTADVEMANDEGADPTNDIKKQNSGEATSPAEAGKKGTSEDPEKVEDLAKAGRADFDPDAGSD